MADRKLPTLGETRKWFAETILPQRTAWAGLSPNRMWKTPGSYITGNVPDANGLCGDAALFTAETYWDEFKDYTTADGYIIGMVLWEGMVLNHMANIMLPRTGAGAKTYKGSPLPPATVLSLTVLDLYYKKTSDLREWWRARDEKFGGKITVGLQHDFA